MSSDSDGSQTDTTHRSDGPPAAAETPAATRALFRRLRDRYGPDSDVGRIAALVLASLDEGDQSSTSTDEASSTSSEEAN